jgi:uncharacterized membrane protein YhaH (DUF805 family)
MSWFLRRGRLGRKTFWLTSFLPVCAAIFVAGRLDVLLFDSTGEPLPSGASIGESFAAEPVTTVVSAALMVPLFSAFITRLHDIGRSAWWLLVATIPVAGFLVLLYFCSQAGDPFPNQYGPPPGRAAAQVPSSGGYAQESGLK